MRSSRGCRRARLCRQAQLCARQRRLVATASTAAVAAAAAGRPCLARRPGRAHRSTTAAAAGHTGLRELCRALATTCDSRWDPRGVTEAAAAPGEASSTSCHRCEHTPNVTHARACCVCVADVCVAVRLCFRSRCVGRTTRAGEGWAACRCAATGRRLVVAAWGGAGATNNARAEHTHTYARRAAHKTTWNNER
jgi:hypothetical protein